MLLIIVENMWRKTIMNYKIIYTTTDITFIISVNVQ